MNCLTGAAAMGRDVSKSLLITGKAELITLHIALSLHLKFKKKLALKHKKSVILSACQA